MEFFSKQYLLFGKIYSCIEHFSASGQEKIACIQLEKTQGELIIQVNALFENITALSTLFTKKQHAFLVINTTNVLQKETTSTDLSDLKVLNKTFSNIQIDDFYYEIVRTIEKSFVSICRKSYITELLNSYKEKEIDIVGVSLGISGITQLLPFLEEEGIIQTNSQYITFNKEIQKTQNIVVSEAVYYSINGLDIENKYILPFAGILNLITKNTQSTGTIIAFNRSLLETFKQNRIFNTGTKTGIGFILALLLINFFVFSYYYKNVENLSTTLNTDKVTTEKIEKAKENISKKEQQVKNIIHSSSSKSSFYINEISKQLPYSIVLNELKYQPLEKKVKEKETIQINPNVIIISGLTKDTEAFSEWVERIEKYSFVEKTIITDFAKNTTDDILFTIHIKLAKNEL